MHINLPFFSSISFRSSWSFVDNQCRLSSTCRCSLCAACRSTSRVASTTSGQCGPRDSHVTPGDTPIRSASWSWLQLYLDIPLPIHLRKDGFYSLLGPKEEIQSEKGKSFSHLRFLWNAIPRKAYALTVASVLLSGHTNHAMLTCCHSITPTNPAISSISTEKLPG